MSQFKKAFEFLPPSRSLALSKYVSELQQAWQILFILYVKLLEQYGDHCKHMSKNVLLNCIILPFMMLYVIEMSSLKDNKIA